MPKRLRRMYSLRRAPRRRSGKKIPLAPVVGLASMFMTSNPSGTSLMGDIQAGDWNRLAYDARERFTCIDNNGQFRFDWLIPHYGPLIAGAVLHLAMNKIGFNRYFDKIPIIGKYLSI